MITATPVTTFSATVLAEAERRRTFAVISHPEADESTMTEALALRGGWLATTCADALCGFDSCLN